MKNSYALVTGATSGIGLEISKDLAKRGYNLILVARTRDKLDSLSSELANEYDIDCDFFASDLTLINSPNEIYEYTSQKKYSVNILINNAGVGITGPLEEIPTSEINKHFQTNVIGPILLIKEVLPFMKSSKKL